MRTPMLLSFLSNFGGEVCRYRLWLWLILGARGGRGRWGGGRMGGDVVRSERRVASLAVITKLVELGYLQPGARHRATAVEWAIRRRIVSGDTSSLLYCRIERRPEIAS